MNIRRLAPILLLVSLPLVGCSSPETAPPGGRIECDIDCTCGGGAA